MNASITTIPGAATKLTGDASAPPATVDAAIVGATGYVGGELLRLLAAHPTLQVRHLLARRAGVAAEALFPHLTGCVGTMATEAMDSLDDQLAGDAPLAIFFALPHAASAAMIDHVMQQAARPLHIVDLSADFRLPSAAAFESIYGGEHPAPDRFKEFHCGLPDLDPTRPSGPVAHPGCFTTATCLGAAPLVARGFVEPRIVVNAITGSTGSGQSPSATTHHPERHGSVRQYAPLTHRHRPEMELLLGRLVPRAGNVMHGSGGLSGSSGSIGSSGSSSRGGSGDSNGTGTGANAAGSIVTDTAAPEVIFTPHSGPFARGILATVTARLRRPRDVDEILAAYREHYASSPFVDVVAGSVGLKSVVGTNRCRIGVATDGRDVVVASAIDNLVKGSAGGAVHWMNRSLGLPDATGLHAPALGWT
ncbi:MAG: N-acetyl-gamma-glutamyl-phosphate reductase [Phycisphaerales bacterium]